MPTALRKSFALKLKADQEGGFKARIATLNVHLADQALHGAADLHDLIRLDQALERSRASAQRRRERPCRHENVEKLRSPHSPLPENASTCSRRRSRFRFCTRT